MNAALEQYIQKRKNEMLIEAGLYEKLYYTKELGDINDFPELEQQNDGFVHYKKVPVDLNDEEYKEFIKYYKPETKAKTLAAPKVLTALAWLTYVAVVIIAIAGFSLNVSVISIITTIISGVVEGTILLGLANVISLLEKINNK